MSTTIDRSHPRPAHSREDQKTYGPVARALHIRRGTPQEGLVDWHLSLGAALMIAVVVRLLWRLRHPTPLTTGTAPWERLISKLTHEVLYFVLLLLPVLGWAAAGYFGYTVRLFGAIPLPALADNTMEWADQAGDLHAALTWFLLGLVGLHVAGALWHYFVRRDRVLQRMLPGL
jgi:cytochrome b561